MKAPRHLHGFFIGRQIKNARTAPEDRIIVIRIL
jgi:hypothetical protein